MTTSDFLKKTISAHPAKGSEVGDVLKSNAEKNIDLVQEFVHKPSDAKDFQDAFRAQSEFMQAQFAAIGEQTKGLSEACGKSAASVFILRHLFRFGASLLRINISPRSLALGQRQQTRIKQRSL